jgi:hypothetical protein
VEIWHWFIYIGGGGYKLGDDLTLAFTSLALAAVENTKMNGDVSDASK